MVITTPRLVLREFVKDDWPAILAYQSDPRYLQYYAWTGRSGDDVRAFVARFIDWQRASPRYRFQLAITLAASGRLIGNCGLRLDEAAGREGELGYELDPAHWGQGYATEAAGAMVRLGFEELDLHRIRAWTVAENAASRRVLEKLGFRLEGLLRENRWFKGRWWDTALYGILESEWLTSRKGGER
ncbi:MAG: GNAT family protein [Anaerolineae bacterium]|jgi:RimJ/RimL family protein N-acetyltransferase